MSGELPSNITQIGDQLSADTTMLLSDIIIPGDLGNIGFDITQIGDQLSADTTMLLSDITIPGDLGCISFDIIQIGTGTPPYFRIISCCAPEANNQDISGSITLDGNLKIEI